MRAYERFMEYVKIDTTPDPSNAGITLPSTQCQFNLANLLVKELHDLGLQNPHVDEQCYVYAWLPATPGYEAAPAIGFIAHLDTSPDASGTNVQPILHTQYDGKDLHLPSGHIIDVATFPRLAELKGKTLISASGDTLLGGDDKAGIANIITALEEIIQNDIPHGRLCIAFTPDEEIGAGANGFDVEKLGARWAYTVDGGLAGEVDYETFNAASAKLQFNGVSVHPGSAKDIMVNASKLAIEFNSLIPQNEAPETTAGRDGFYHLHDLRGTVEKAACEYIIRDHDRAIFEKRKQFIRDAVDKIQLRYGENSVELTLQDNYYNMGEVIQENFHLVDNACDAIRAVGLEPVITPVRGGTDGSRLSFMGLPCPNLGTGAMYGHGPSELCVVESMDESVQILIHIVKKYASSHYE